MLQKIYKHKHFTKIMIALIVVIVIALYIRKKKKEEQFELLMTAIKDPSGFGSAEGSAEAVKSFKGFDPRYWETVKSKAGTVLIPSETLKNYAKIIYDAKGVVSDDEKSVISVLRSIGYQSQLSQLSDYFAKTYKRDLVTYLKSFMDVGDNDMSTVLGIVQKYK